MTREEAIEVYNGLLNQKIKEAFEFFVPELRESEDERIRKILIDAFEKKNNSFIDELVDCRLTKADILAWLEKQKEVKVKYVYPKFRIGDIISYNKPEPGFSDYTIVGFNNEMPDYLVDGGNVPSCSIGIEFIDSNYHLKEQKPAEWCEEDEKWFKEIELMALSFSNSADYREKFFNWLKSLPERFNLQPKQEWSEEDKRNLNRILNIIRWAADSDRMNRIVGDKEAIELEDFLKSLRSQPKNKWSEEDMINMELLIAILKGKVSFPEVTDKKKDSIKRFLEFIMTSELMVPASGKGVYQQSTIGGIIFDILYYLEGRMKLSAKRKIECIDFLKALRSLK